MKSDDSARACSPLGLHVLCITSEENFKILKSKSDIIVYVVCDTLQLGTGCFSSHLAVAGSRYYGTH